MDADLIVYSNTGPVKHGDYILYWMQAAQRIHGNHALALAADEAARLNLPLVVYFGLTSDFPDADLRHYRFMLEGLCDVEAGLKKLSIPFILRLEAPDQGVLQLASNAASVITDNGWLRIQRTWRRNVAEHLICRFQVVETECIVPVQIASSKDEYAAATIRRKIHKRLDQYLNLPPDLHYQPTASIPNLKGESLHTIDKILSLLPLNRSVPPVKSFIGGQNRGLKVLEDFIHTRLDRYHTDRNDPSKHAVSNLSPYLHFGQVSPHFIACSVRDADSPGTAAFLEEFIVRRELAWNFVRYNSAYDSIDCLPQWAQKTLHDHRNDPREYIYDVQQLERAQTHDPAWNAAQMEMLLTGKMHGYMRMYWGKKLIEWTETPESAYNVALYLNNKWELDGRDPNGFAGIAWCFGKHDRAWAERPVFGKVRYMNFNGLKRKFNIHDYIATICKSADELGAVP